MKVENVFCRFGIVDLFTILPHVPGLIYSIYLVERDKMIYLFFCDMMVYKYVFIYVYMYNVCISRHFILLKNISYTRYLKSTLIR